MPKRKTSTAGQRESDVVHKSMPIQEIITLLPQAKSILAEYGLHCFSCAGSEYETLGEGCTGHGFSDEEIDELVDDLNQMFRDLPERPQTITVTLESARAIKKVADDEGRADEGLAVIADASGGFCMEFRPQAKPQPVPVPDEKIFFHKSLPSVRVFASPLTLKRIGGATIDFREGRFKLDLPEDAKIGGCGCDAGSLAPQNPESNVGCGCREKSQGEAK